jgi:hypothetical protein
VKWWDRVGEKIENIARKAEFVSAYRQARLPVEKGGLGYSHLAARAYAAMQARGLLDTAESGRTIGRLNRWFLFLNAAVKGLERTTKISRAAVAARKRAYSAARAAGKTRAEASADAAADSVANRLTALMTVRLAVLGGTLYGLRLLLLAMCDDKEQEELLTQPAWKRDFNLILPDFGMGKIGIAKPYEWGFVGSGFERLADVTFAMAKADSLAAQGKPDAAKRWREHAHRAYEGYGHSAVVALFPVKFDDVLGGAWAPLAEVVMNRSLFTDSPIIPQHELGKNLELRAGADNGSPLGRGLSTVLAPVVGDRIGDPRSLDHLVRGYGGGIGAMLTARTLGEVFSRGSGMSGETSPYASRDVRFVLDWAAKNGVAGRKPYRDLLALAKAARDAKPDKQAERADIMRRRAGALRRMIEKGGVPGAESD